MKLHHRHRSAFGMSVAASVASLALAIGHNLYGEYDANLAVLTATLISLIWYTFFTYCALHRVEPVQLRVNIVKTPKQRQIEVVIENETASRRITYVWRVVVQRDGKRMATTTSLDGESKHRFTLKPREQRSEAFTLAQAQKAPNATVGPRVQLGESPHAVLRLDVAWRDDLGERGALPAEYWAIDVLFADPSRYQDEAFGQKEWERLGGAVDGPLTA